ncbi:class III lanthionine synthetase LanKC [Amycolatopsis albispora]|uniref:non-specific serine/threonine protein kinase n=1 Tax=Amycolatopsis albispora TaxID=1804986 RepID=A0A344L5G6_9PSEU|nr:class III lanthionine synthetase LanKC [Amycolatopsis albispora]AXB43290.1 hypothetical protein A4R43_12600 [Amycolatopsis albispora]
MSVAARQVYCFADQVFYETPDRWEREHSSFGVSAREVPAGWRRTDRGFWTHLSPIGAELPEQGWKIHVTAGPADLEQACDLVWDYCVARNLPFKHLSTPHTYLAVNSKYAPRGASGKLVTIYPADERQLESVLLDLEKELDGVRGPDILSDLRWRESPLFVRYGSFVERYCLDADGEFVAALATPDGELVPDLRKPVFTVPDWVRVPEFLAESEHARRAADRFPYRVLKALHFSNGGGVYLAERESDGKRVVLKEARALAGLDRGFGDAPGRLAREHRALTELAGIPGIPEWYDFFEAGGSQFLAMEYVEGTSLWVWMAKNHPMILFDLPEPEAYRAYRDEALDLLGRIGEILDQVHARGIGFGDLHFGNVMVRPDGSIALVDFEMIFDLADPDYSPVMGTMGFIAGREARGLELDDYAFAALKLALFFPMEKMRVFDHAKLAQQLGIIGDRFGLDEEFLGAIRSKLGDPKVRPLAPPGLGEKPLEVDFAAGVPDWPSMISSMQRAILASAEPSRTDRLFPGDSAQFRAGGGVNLAHGAAGVLWALARTGVRDEGLERWLAEAATRIEHQPPGFYNGLHGVAYALDFLGHSAEAHRLLDRAGGQSAAIREIGLYKGLSGIGLNWLHFGEYERAAAAAATLAAALESGGGEAGAATSVKGGLLHGWSGPALLFVRMAEHTGDPAFLDLAVRALHRDLDQCVVTRSGSLQVEERGTRTLAYLDVGSAGIALVADELLPHRADERIAEALPRLLTACSSEFVLQPQLFSGRAGLLAALDRNRRRDPGLAGLDELIERHLVRQSWHAVSYRGHLAFPGDFGLRLSMDLGTGTAGVLLTTAACTGQSGAFLPFFSDRPAAGVDHRREAVLEATA